MADRELSRAPSMLPLFARAGAALIPGAARLPFIGGGGGEIPDQTLTLSEVSVDRERLAAYDRVCGFALSDTLPPTYVHMLAFPLHLALITDGHFPLPAIGLIHIANTIIVHRPIGAGERLSLRVWATAIEPHRRGRELLIAGLLAMGGAAMIADDAQHVLAVLLVAGEGAEDRRHLRRGRACDRTRTAPRRAGPAGRRGIRCRPGRR